MTRRAAKVDGTCNTYSVYTFTVEGPPATKGSTVSWWDQRAQKVITRTDSVGLASWTDAVRWAAKGAKLERGLPESPVRVRVEFVVARPKRAKRDTPAVRPDLDKWVRALLDALTGYAYHDDGQVVEIAAVKRYGEMWQTHIRVETA